MYVYLYFALPRLDAQFSLVWFGFDDSTRRKKGSQALTAFFGADEHTGDYRSVTEITEDDRLKVNSLDLENFELLEPEFLRQTSEPSDCPCHSRKCLGSIVISKKKYGTQ